MLHRFLHALRAATLKLAVVGFAGGLALISTKAHSAEAETAAEAHISIANFARDSISVFKEKSFVGHTHYQVVEQNGRRVLRAETDQQASSLYQEISVDLNKTPMLNWSWRVDNVHAIDDQQIKAGDDYPARVYVVVRDGLFPWQARALNYVWSNHTVTLDHWANPFTDKAMMIPQRAGSEGLGQWHNERVNIAEDFQRVYGDRIEKIDGVAIMTDADNAGGKAVAYYGDIFFSP